MQSTMNLATYAIAGAIAFALVGGIGFLLMSSVIKNLRDKPAEESEQEEEVIKEVVKEKAVKEKVKKVSPSPVVKPEPIKKYKEVTLTKLVDTVVAEQFSLRLEDSLNIGRTKDKNDWAITEDHTVSSKHCKLYIADKKVYLVDLNSTNGTYVNGKLINQPVALNSQDIIRMGASEYKIDIR